MILLKTNEHFEKAALIAGMLSDDQHCFSGLYDRYAASLLGLLMKWAKEKEKAEMLLHQTFIKAWHNRKLFEAENEDFFYWLCKLARNCYDENSVK
jgi:RNA polymerase sigma-70 factor (ECF subfamily)